jgi:hypothetical protein
MRRTFWLLLAYLATWCIGCGQHPVIDVVSHVDDDDVVFEISAKGINRIWSFRVEDESGNKIWSINSSENLVAYGKLPEGRPDAQTFPPERKAPADIRGKTIVVVVVYQYDAFAAPSSGRFRKTLQIP